MAWHGLAPWQMQPPVRAATVFRAGLSVCILLTTWSDTCNPMLDASKKGGRPRYPGAVLLALPL